VTVKEFSGAKEKCGSGGSEFTAGATKGYACNGTTGFTETLPEGKSETGAWNIISTTEEFNEGVKAITAISFTIPLEASLSKEHVFFIPPGEAGKVDAAQCPGSVASPAAAQGDFCAYAQVLNNTEVAGDPIDLPSGGFPNAGAGSSGALLALEIQAAAYGLSYGTWAVTAP
jgi:hypothetical protein